MQQRRVNFHTLGCKLNFSESSTLAREFERGGFVRVAPDAEADICVINSCSVTEHADKKCRNLIRKLHRRNPGAIIAVTGCYAQLKPQEIAAIEGVGIVLSNNDKGMLYKRVVELSGKGRAQIYSCDTESLTSFFAAFSSGDRTRAFLKVQDGCSHGCAYCIVPLTRGPARSRPPKDCLAEMRRLLEAGYREIMISGINLRQYAMRDEGCRDFWDLLSYLDRELAPEWGSGARPDPARFRISSVEPAQLTERGIATLAETRMVCPHLHLSLQSGSADVLKAMRRGHYTPEALLSAVEGVAKLWPRFGLGADILMGFPGETEAHALETLEVVRSLPLTYAHVFPYSARPGTVAAELPDQVGKAVRQERAARVRAVVEAKREAFWKDTLTCERLLVALDCNEDAGSASGQHGVDECYVPCRLRTPLRGEGHTLIPVRPVSVSRKGVIVEPLRP